MTSFCINDRSPNNVSFKAGKLKIFSDFDGTYCNFSHLSICKEDVLLKDPLKRDFFMDFYGKFKAFKDKAKNSLEFIITTGRNREEFNYFIGKINSQNQTIPLPEKIITRDGCDIFTIKNNTFAEQDYDKNKRTEIFGFSNGWDGGQIRKDLKNIISEIFQSKINIIDAPVNKHEMDYGEISLERILKSADSDTKHNFVSFRNDGDLSFHITGGLSTPFEHITKKFEEYFQKKNIFAQVNLNENDFNAIIPIFDKNNHFEGLAASKSITVRPIIKSELYSGVLNKLFDTRKAVKEVIDKKSNDIVIIAGDDANDYEALNPLSYVDLLGLPNPPKELDKQIAYIQKYKKKIQELPIVFVVAGKRDNLNGIRNMAQHLNYDNARKIICIDNEQVTLTEGIEEGIKDYSRQNPKFNKHLPKSLKSHLGQEKINIITRLKDFIKRKGSEKKTA